MNGKTGYVQIYSPSFKVKVTPDVEKLVAWWDKESKRRREAVLAQLLAPIAPRKERKARMVRINWEAGKRSPGRKA